MSWMSYDQIWIGLGAALLLVLGSIACLGIWTYQDAKARGLDGGIWTIIVILVPNLIGLLLYFLIGRKQQRALCASCGGQTELGKHYCSNCGVSLVQPGMTVPSDAKHSKKPLIAAMVGMILTSLLVLGVVIGSLYAAQPEMFAAKNVSIGQTQTMRPGIWKLSFWYFNGEKVQAIKIKQGESKQITLDTEIKKGTVEAVISLDGKEQKRLLLNELDTPYIWDLSDLPDSGRITLHLYAEEARGKVNMDWR
ncbi:hypothetical protein J41TS12_48890 [Paenibacillus antibioticophila]|uniref:Zinc ribbon domain-containing protein n=1 Tax=Paenibacillus antibioticophila TaxID=1274374 RepID=A0A919XYJ0_9BACL|nr:PLDc_N domain-containing protein [Paenibacillus antibioticophila]GIO40028.1 hypothetical protein J41TS12_48890 [Paenibacillus antibioticophila]